MTGDSLPSPPFWFLVLKGLQSGLFVTALVLCLTCGNALVRRGRDRPLPEGYWMTLGMFLMGLGMLILFGYQTAQYWLYGADRPVFVPLWIRIAADIPYLTGGAIFVALTQQAVIGARATFLLWSALVASLVLMTVAAG